jgi:hypothetical protein
MQEGPTAFQRGQDRTVEVGAYLGHPWELWARKITVGTPLPLWGGPKSSEPPCQTTHNASCFLCG